MNGLVLWDVDHTLIENSGVSKRTYSGAFERLTGQTTQHPARTMGRTDREIMADLLEQHGVPSDTYEPEQVRSALIDSLSELEATLVEVGWVLPGGRECLAALAEMQGVVQAVLTGNVRENGYVKLAAFGLAENLDWDSGAYGFDAEDRPGLVAVAQARATEGHGVRFTAASTILIGDTINDVRAGREGGAHVIAVTTGEDSRERLTAAGADVVLKDLADVDYFTGAVTALLDGTS